MVCSFRYLRTGYGYKLKSRITISHLIYMNDIKFYAKSEQDIRSLIYPIWIYSENIRMLFGLEKYDQMLEESSSQCTEILPHVQTQRLYTNRKESRQSLLVLNPLSWTKYRASRCASIKWQLKMSC